MTAKEAWERSEMGFIFKSRKFSIIKWRSPTSGQVIDNIPVTIEGSTAIEILLNGEFKDAFPAVAEHYEPVIVGKKEKKETIKVSRQKADKKSKK